MKATRPITRPSLFGTWWKKNVVLIPEFYADSAESSMHASWSFTAAIQNLASQISKLAFITEFPYKVSLFLKTILFQILLTSNTLRIKNAASKSTRQDSDHYWRRLG